MDDPNVPDKPLTSDPNMRVGLEPPATTPAEVKRRHDANRVAWNEGAAHYRAELADTVAFIRAGRSNLHPIERANFKRLTGPLADWCESAVHLQCASGRDTLSLYNEGVPNVVGVDISDVHIETAKQTSAQLGVPATWHACDILDTPDTLNASADLVYTGRGALCWLHDIDAWAQVVARLLKPGGVLHVLDEHPVSWLFDTHAADYRPVAIDYFRHSESVRGWPESYLGNAGRDASEMALKYERVWTLSDVVNAVVGAGLRVEYLGEHPESYWDIFPNLKPELRGLIPLTFSLLARRPL